MRISIIAVGRARSDPEQALTNDFLSRLSATATVIEVEARKSLSPAERVKDEGRLLLAKAPEGAVTVALDGRGKQLTSEAFAAQLDTWRDMGIQDLAFLIGGADGLDQTVIEAADFVLSLGTMTWPHLLVRGMLAEQLYRAESIRAGHPYHRAGPPPRTAKSGRR